MNLSAHFGGRFLFAIWIRVLFYELAMDVLPMKSHPANLFDYVLLSSGPTAGDG